MVYAITLDFENPEKDYSALYDKIKSLGSWMHHLEFTWFVAPSTERSAEDIFTQLQPFIDKEDDYMLVVEVTSNYQGWLPDEAWDWMNERIS